MTHTPISEADIVARRAAYHTSVYDFAKVAIQVLVAVSSGDFVTALATSGETLRHNPEGVALMSMALAGFGASIVLAVTCACFSYLNQAYIAFWGERVWLAHVARLPAWLSYVSFIVAGVALAVLKIVSVTAGR